MRRRKPKSKAAKHIVAWVLHVFMHELGHHYDRINQKHLDSWKGEDYAEGFATSRFGQLFPDYVRVFGHPAITT